MPKANLVDIVDTVAKRVIAHADELTALDQAIGDGDHGINMKRGFEAVRDTLGDLQDAPVSDALKKVGMTLVMKIGGASGPLYGTLAMTLGKELDGREIDKDALAEAFHAAVDAVARRGKSTAGQKTMLDVLVPVQDALKVTGLDRIGELRGVADAAATATVEMQATRGRASFLGERSIGHMDPGARSSALMIGAVCDVLEGRP